MDLTFVNNQTWNLALNIAQWGDLYPLIACQFQLQMRAKPEVDPIAYAWLSNPPPGFTQGKITYTPDTGLLFLSAPKSDMIKIAPGDYFYDLQLIYGDFVKDLTIGKITIIQGNSR